MRKLFLFYRRLRKDFFKIKAVIKGKLCFKTLESRHNITFEE